MSVCLVGSNGNMGRRYAAILKYLKNDFHPVDINEPLPVVEKYILATPTQTHVDMIGYIKSLSPDASILCEKPITTDIQDFDRIPKEHWESVFMVNNYRYMSFPKYVGKTLYDFYNSGGDGLAWDCIQLIHLAKGDIELSNKSHFWRCWINDMPLSKGDIDHSYFYMILDFIKSNTQKLWNLHEAYEAHKKVLAYMEKHDVN